MRQDTKDYQPIGVQAIYSNGELVYKDQQYKADTEAHQSQGRDKTNVSVIVGHKTFQAID